MTFLDALQSEPSGSHPPGVRRPGGVLLMDGAMGTQLAEAFSTPGGGEAWNLSRPGGVLAVHRAYREAGARVFLTNTFQANVDALARHGLDHRLADIIARSVSLARRAAGSNGFVLADVGPILGPEGEEFSHRQDLADVFACFENVDGYLLETCSSPAALAAVEFARHRVGGIEDQPILLSLAYETRAGRVVTHSGHGPETYARHAARHGVSALGVNCGRDIGKDELLTVLRRYRDETDLPLFVRPNAGTPTQVADQWVYPRGPEEMASWLPDLVSLGVRMVGGCCGTTPEHIAAFRRVLEAG
jgi:5-methyltetrahydrofolate--homocysteine methyltransferase